MKRHNEEEEENKMQSVAILFGTALLLRLLTNAGFGYGM